MSGHVAKYATGETQDLLTRNLPAVTLRVGIIMATCWGLSSLPYYAHTRTHTHTHTHTNLHIPIQIIAM